MSLYMFPLRIDFHSPTPTTITTVHVFTPENKFQLVVLKKKKQVDPAVCKLS